MPNFSKTLVLSTLFALAANAASANNYEQCLIIVSRDPDRGHEIATTWRDYGGGAPAEHCLALALIGQGKPDEAAEVLDIMVTSVNSDPMAKDRSPEANEAQKADLLSQAGNAWLMAEAPDKAYVRFTEALATPGLPIEWRVETLIDRARAAAALDNHEFAVGDLTAAVDLVGPRPDVLAYRAAAHRTLNAFDRARADVEAALSLDPSSVEALLERAHLNLLDGDVDGAEADWSRVMQLEADTPAALAAEANLRALKEPVNAPATPAAPQDQPPAEDVDPEAPEADPVPTP